MLHCILGRKACHLFAFALLIPFFSAPLFSQTSSEKAEGSAQQSEAGSPVGTKVTDPYLLAHDSLSALLELAEGGNAQAQERLGHKYRNGEGAPVDKLQALAWYRKAAEQGRGNAAIMIGEMYENGEGVAPDFEQAVAWYRRPLESGSGYATRAKLHINDLLQKHPEAEAFVPAQDRKQVSALAGPRPWTPALPSVFGADIVRTAKGDPALKFIGHPDGASAHTRTIEFKMYEGKPAFALHTYHSLGKWTTKSTSGCLIFAKNQVVYEVTGGAVRPEDSFLEPKLVEIRKGGSWHFISVALKSPERKADFWLGYADSKDLHLYNFLMRLLQDFDGTLAQFEAATNLSDPDRQLSAAAHFHRLSNSELVDAVEAEKRAEKEAAAKRSGHGDGWLIAGAIALGTAQGLSGGGSDSAILQAGAQQAAAIRAVGDQNAASQQQAVQARIAAEQARAAQAAQEKERERIAAEQKQREIAAARQRAIAAAGNSAGTSGGQAAGDATGSSAGPVHSSRPVTCTSMNNLVSVRSKWGKSCEHEVVTWLTNNSNESVDCVYAFHRNGKFGDSGMTTIPSGQTRGGEGGGMWTCGADTDQVEYACFPHKQNEDQTFACTSRVKW